MSNLAEITADLSHAGWEATPKEQLLHIDALYISRYAAVGLLFAESADDALSRWREAQEELQQLPADKRVGRLVDLYLVILIPELGDSDLSALSEVVSDTQVCRKTIIEIGEREIREALADLPYFALLSQDLHDESATSRPNGPTAPPREPLSLELLEKLATTPAGTILEELLENSAPKRERG